MNKSDKLIRSNIQVTLKAGSLTDPSQPLKDVIISWAHENNLAHPMVDVFNFVDSVATTAPTTKDLQRDIKALLPIATYNLLSSTVKTTPVAAVRFIRAQTGWSLRRSRQVAVFWDENL